MEFMHELSEDIHLLMGMRVVNINSNTSTIGPVAFNVNYSHLSTLFTEFIDHLISSLDKEADIPF